MSSLDSESAVSLTNDDLLRYVYPDEQNNDGSGSDIDVEDGRVENDSDDDFQQGDNTDNTTSDSETSDPGDHGDAGAVGVTGCSSSQWSNDDFLTEIHLFDAYRGPPSPQVNCQSPFDYFSLVFPLEAYNIMARETNLYARQLLLASGVSEERLYDRFQPTTVDEIRAYIGLQMFMNVAPVPQRTFYWKEGSLFYNNWVASIMSKNRFEQLGKYFHLADSTKAVPRGQAGYDPLYKVRPLISLTQESFSSQFVPGRNVTVDEAMIKFKGRCGFLQYMPAKPTKWGVKVWALCDADSFYMLNYSVYTGKINDLPAGSGEPLGDRVVKHLVEPLLHSWHTIYFDNYFTSVSLIDYLFKNETQACGTVRNNRKGLPEQMKPAKCVKKHGDTKRWFRQIDDNKKKGKLQAIAWFDRRKTEIFKGMVAGFNGRKRLGRPCVRDVSVRARLSPSKIQSARGKKDCVLCKQNGRRTPAGNAIQSTYECVICKVALCKDRGCFRSFHQE
ncbi:hypothetical protein ACOMHN_000420 [Nucella lapillus]